MTPWHVFRGQESPYSDTPMSVNFSLATNSATPFVVRSLQPNPDIAFHLTRRTVLFHITVRSCFLHTEKLWVPAAVHSMNYHAVTSERSTILTVSSRCWLLLNIACRASLHHVVFDHWLSDVQLMQWQVRHFPLHHIVTVNVQIPLRQRVIVRQQLKLCRSRRKKIHNVLSIKRYVLSTALSNPKHSLYHGHLLSAFHIFVVGECINCKFGVQLIVASPSQ